MPKQPTEPNVPSAPSARSAPSPTITIAEAEAPRGRPYKSPALIAEEKLPPPAPRMQSPQVITDGQVIIKAEGDRIIAQRIGDAQPANTEPGPPAPLSARALSKRAIEQEAGRRAVARAAEDLAHRPPLVRTPQEIAAEGTNTPVFRPGDFSEYRDMRRNAVSKDSGSSVLQRVKQTLPEG